MTRPYMTHPPRLLQLAVPCRTGLSRHLPPFCSAQLRRLRLFRLRRVLRWLQHRRRMQDVVLGFPLLEPGLLDNNARVFLQRKF